MSVVVQCSRLPGSKTTVPPQRMSFRDIADDLESRIHRQEYPPGAKLPSAAEIADTYSVSKNTAQHALSLLREGALPG